MMRKHYRTHGWLGVELNYQCSHSGPTVNRVFANSPAEDAGFRQGDIVTSVNGISFLPASRPALQSFMERRFKAGNTLRYTVKRAGEIQHLQATLEPISQERLNELIAHHVEQMHASDQGSGS
jgi:S1-C subfamily serine protease